MTRCVYCEGKLPWSFIFKRLLIVKRTDIQCPSCHQTLYFTSRSKGILLGTTMLIPVLFVLAFMLGNMTLFVVITLGWMLGMPWFVDVTEKDEALF
ncbi:hypothetical protein KYJ26_12365 [Bacillus sp. MCCB 382]|uniref:TIGR04104 family putative zinc finger protein n=1 Tax=Bacillus sp. MCCB 382 TaxID=2860197 RepID=UPI001C56FF0C|nr:hypothetical protein [Bacillus sp. MCCB 382]